MRSRLAGILSLLMLFMAGGLRAQDFQPTEYELKAAYLFNFAKFVVWPETAFHDAQAPFVIGILGDDPFQGALEKIIGKKTVNNRPFTIKKVLLAEATNCHILFISSSEEKRFPEIFKALDKSAVLTVGESAGFNGAGGMVNFFAEDAKLRFEINNDPAKKARLEISSKLLSLARPRHAEIGVPFPMLCQLGPTQFEVLRREQNLLFE